ncbi:MAG: M2 family metallopeptidase, partial [Nannocystaceae bacterium]
MHRYVVRIGTPNLLTACALLTALAGCPAKSPEPKSEVSDGKSDGEAAQLEDPAGEFVRKNDAKLRELWVDAETKLWNQQTNINEENEKAASEAHERVMAYESTAIGEAARLLPQAKSDSDKRQLELMTRVATLPAPNDDAKRKQLAGLATEMESIYGKGKFCTDPAKPETCKDLGALSDVLAESRDPKSLLEAWEGWRSISKGKMREDYVTFAALGNEGARELGFKDMGELWRSKYDMTAAEFEAEMERLWKQVEPLYQQLHCHVRAKLNEKYGDEIVSKDGKIPAHLLGNMWAQEWANIYPLMEPYAGQPSIDVTQALQDKGFDELKMVRAAESFFTSLGLDPLPDTFWERSMFKKPEDRDVVCHASAWDVGLSNDLRIKMCIKINMEDLI